MNRHIKILVLLATLIGCDLAKAQTLGPYTLYDRLVSAVHPTGCNASFVTGWPNDSIWVNLTNGQVATGTFSMLWTDQAGDDLLLETGFHTDNYAVRLMLQGGGFSTPHNVVQADWTFLSNVPWVYTWTACGVSTIGNRQQYYLPLDFNADFGVTGATVVTGIEITFITTSGAPDFSGAYMINVPPLVEDILDFSVSPVNGPEAMLSWTATNTLNTSLFEVERSSNAQEWKKVLTVAPELKGIYTSEFKINDSAPLSGTSFYRLRVIDQDGSFGYSAVRSVHVGDESKPVIYPNPATGELFVRNVDGPFPFAIFDVAGKKLLQATSADARIDLTGLPAGAYFLRLHSSGVPALLKFRKH